MLAPACGTIMIPGSERDMHSHSVTRPIAMTHNDTLHNDLSYASVDTYVKVPAVSLPYRRRNNPLLNAHVLVAGYARRYKLICSKSIKIYIIQLTFLYQKSIIMLTASIQ